VVYETKSVIFSVQCHFKLKVTSSFVIVLLAIIRMHNFSYRKSNSSCKFRLHTAAIFGPYVSESTKRKLHSCSNTYSYKVCAFYNYMCGYSCGRHEDGCFVQSKHAAAVGFAVIKVVCTRTASLLLVVFLTTSR